VATTAEKVVIAAAAAALITLGIVIAGFLAPGDGEPMLPDEEERPPVVVSNGSVIFDVDDSVHGKKLGKGSFVNRLGTNLFLHQNPGSDIPIGFLVTIEGSSTPACRATPFKTKKLTLKYGNDADNVEADVFLDEFDGAGQEQLAVDKKDVALSVPNNAEPWRFELHRENGPQAKYWIKSVSLERAAGPNTVACEFPNAMTTKITIRQPSRWPK
jgi:hypothetical protein